MTQERDDVPLYPDEHCRTRPYTASEMCRLSEVDVQHIANELHVMGDTPIFDESKREGFPLDPPTTDHRLYDTPCRYDDSQPIHPFADGTFQGFGMEKQLMNTDDKDHLVIFETPPRDGVCLVLNQVAHKQSNSVWVMLAGADWEVMISTLDEGDPQFTWVELPALQHPNASIEQRVVALEQTLIIEAESFKEEAERKVRERVMVQAVIAECYPRKGA